MFTGIVEATGEIVAVDSDADGRRIRVEAPLEGLQHGQSIAVSGVCLTVEAFGEGWFELFCSTETLDRTYLGELGEGDTVNIERAMAADGRFDGHVVQGHVDGTAEITGIESVGEDWTFRFSVPDDLARYLVPKGSVTVDGISLTIADLASDEFAVAIIPATYELTTLSGASVGDPVHLEVDVIAKYVERLLAADADLTASQSRYAERFEE